MLERAAGCLESAGRRFFRDSNGVTRSRRSLGRSLWQYTGASAPLQPPDQRASYTQSATAGAGGAPSSGRIPALDFLYPPRTQEYAASCLLHRPKKPVPRRKKAIPNSSKAYSTKTHYSSQDGAADGPEPFITGFDKRIEGNGDDKQTRARKELNSLLRQMGEMDHDNAWELYEAAGYPADLNSALLAQFCRTRLARDHSRSKPLFGGIPTESRSSEDYLHMSMSYANADNLREMKRTYQEASINGAGNSSWAFTFARLLNNEQISDALEVWELRPKTFEDQWADLVASHLDALSLPKNILALATFLTNLKGDTSARQFTSSLIDIAFASPKVVENTSVETLLLILRKHKGLGVVNRDHYYQLIETLTSSEIRSTFVKSIVIYRSFRWQMKSEIPPAKSLRLILHGLVKFDIISGLEYVLNEIAHFYGKPSKGDYRRALSALARAGDVARVNGMFGMLLKNHGKPRIFSLLAPLLYVHATVGNVQDTRVQFERVSNEFGMVPNTVCWNIMLTAHLNNDDLHGAFSTFDEMLGKGAKPDSYSFGILMGLCANRGDIDNVFRLLTLLKESRVQITSALLDPIVESYCNNQLLDLAEQVAEACLGLNVKGSLVRMWNVLLWNHAFRIDLEAISRIRSRMEAAGIQPDGMSYSALMLSLVLIGRTDSARRILRTLHRGRRIHATEFHYAIILLGYVKSRNRDMVHVVFQEIKERFNRPGFSSRLLVLRSQLQRDLQQIKSRRRPTEAARSRLEHAEKVLTETIGESNTMMLATKHPSPGIGRQSLRQAFPSMYYEYVIAAYGTIGASSRVKSLFDEFSSVQLQFNRSNDASKLPPLRLLGALMFAHLNAGEFDKVEECWMMAFPRAVKMARRVDIDDWVFARRPSVGLDEDVSPPLPDASHGGTELLVTSGTREQKKEGEILPSFRFLLSRALSLYMRSLAYRRETWRIAEVVAQVQDAGFALSTFNWSTYVQLLCSSEQASDQVKAFAIFEEKFMPNYPGWRHLRRSRGIRPPGAPEFTNVMDKRNSPPHLFGREARKIYKKLQPDFMQPTYIAMVSLASTLLGFRERSIAAGNAEVKALYEIAPRTIDAIADMPYLRDKWQGVLLRGRQVQGDRHGDNERRQPFVWTGGVLGVGGETRMGRDVEEQTDEPSAEDGISPVSGVSVGQVDEAPDDEDAILRDNAPVHPEKILDPQDEYDIEVETQLEAQRRATEATDDQLDTDEPWASNHVSDTDEDPAPMSRAAQETASQRESEQDADVNEEVD